MMTLILTEVTHMGIAMAADSAVTITKRLPGSRSVIRVLTGFQKLQYIPKINAGISFWGQANIGRLPLDVWLTDFINNHMNQYDSLESFARLLERELRLVIPPLKNPNPEQLRYGTIGFHLSSITEYEGQMLPDFWHIHNGRSTTLENRGIQIDPYIVNANHDLPPEIIASLPENAMQLVRNGDIQIYINLYELLRSFFEELQKKLRITIPITRPLLSDRCDWLRFQIELISNLYKFSNLLPSIGGEIATLWISIDGCHGLNLPRLKIGVS